MLLFLMGLESNRVCAWPLGEFWMEKMFAEEVET